MVSLRPILLLTPTLRTLTAFTPSFPRSSRTFLRPTTALHATKSQPQQQPIPTILLAGFLGSGKTTTLKHLLENNSSIKIGTIVNDVASVNIDAKLVSNSDSLSDRDSNGVIELQNGCACCSLADELMTSIMSLTSDGERELDAIVVELSGVADPVAVRDNWNMAMLQGHPATRLASLSRTVTLIDASTFGTDWMTWDTAGDRPQWTEVGDDCSAVRKVPELLAEQVEAADLLLVNKVDLAGRDQTQIASGLARGLNEKAGVVEVEFGEVDAKELLGSLEILKEMDDSHDHEHEHSHDDKCSDPDCTDDSHSHSHNHDHSSEASCSDPECTDASHSHSHSHDHSEGSCSDPDCTDTSHSHSHDHSEGACTDPDCTDTSHSHTHSHDHQSTATDQLGITSFVYKQSKPFNSQRLLALLNRWPLPIKDTLDLDLQMGSDEIKEGQEEEEMAFAGVLRSKGFCWMAPSKWSGGMGSDCKFQDSIHFVFQIYIFYHNNLSLCNFLYST